MNSDIVQPTVSVVIPARNAEDVLPDCLNALMSQSCTTSDIEIIVVDDNSSDNTVKVAKNMGAKVISNRGRGPAAGRNTGAKNAKGDILLFTDADCRPEPQWIYNMLKVFKDLSVIGTKGVYRTNQKNLTARFVQAEYESKYRFMSQFPEIDFIDTYSAGFRRDVFLDIGGYDETFPGASVEDQEFSFRLSEAQYKLVFNPDAVVVHLHASSLWKYFRKKLNIAFWKVRVLRQHPKKILHDTHTPQQLKLQIPVSFLILICAMLTPWIGFVPLVLFLFIFISLGFREIKECIIKKDTKLVLISPLILLVRSWGLGLGLIIGTLSPNQYGIDR